jgi:hypothetical protein
MSTTELNRRIQQEDALLDLLDNVNDIDPLDELDMEDGYIFGTRPLNEDYEDDYQDVENDPDYDDEDWSME